MTLTHTPPLWTDAGQPELTPHQLLRLLTAEVEMMLERLAAAGVRWDDQPAKAAPAEPPSSASPPLRPITLLPGPAASPPVQLAREQVEREPVVAEPVAAREPAIRVTIDPQSTTPSILRLPLAGARAQPFRLDTNSNKSDKGVANARAATRRNSLLVLERGLAENTEGGDMSPEALAKLRGFGESLRGANFCTCACERLCARTHGQAHRGC